MFTRKALVGSVAALAVAGLVWTTANAGSGLSPNKVKQLDTGNPTSTTNAACTTPVPGGCCQPCNYFEDFENQADFVNGMNVSGQGAATPELYYKWFAACQNGASAAQDVSQANPAGGSIQHVRLYYDPAQITGGPGDCIVSARVPVNAVANVNNPPISAPTIVEVDVSISAPFGSDFMVQPQGRGDAGRFSPRVLFFYYGSLYVLDDTGAGATFVNFGSWDTSGAYQPWVMTIDPCANTITYDYGNGLASYTDVDSTTGSGMVRFIDQFLVYHDNFANAENYDIDNVHISRNPTPCPAVCGDGTLTVPEQCDGAIDSACPGRCNPDCTCQVPCGGQIPNADPCQACDVVNDVEYTEISSGGWFKFVASAPAYAFETCGINIPGGGAYDSSLSVWSGDCATGLTLIESNDDCDDNTYGYGVNADPLASCYTLGGIPSPYQSCLCVDNLNLGETYYVSDERADLGLGRRIHFLASKRATCDAIWGERGACCDTNGADQGCTDDVAAVDCQGPDKVYTENKSCGSAEAGPCDCIPLCTGLECGDDGCGGSCGTCDDGVACTVDSCVQGQCVETPDDAACDDGNVCNGSETCTPQGCANGTPLSCDNGLFCDGVEGCDPLTGCTDGADPCDPATEICDEATDSCEPAAIPTVSEWGLAIMSLLLLVGLKVYFGRREALA